MLDPNIQAADAESRLQPRTTRGVPEPERRLRQLQLEECLRRPGVEPRDPAAEPQLLLVGDDANRREARANGVDRAVGRGVVHQYDLVRDAKAQRSIDARHASTSGAPLKVTMTMEITAPPITSSVTDSYAQAC